MPDRWVDKIESTYSKINIIGADIPTAEDVGRYSEISLYHDHFWVRPSEKDACESIVYNKDGYHSMCPEDFAVVVPILRICLPADNSLLADEQNGLWIGDRFLFAGKEFVVADVDTAVCTADLGSSYYGFEGEESYKVVKYENSLPKFEIDTWFERAINRTL